MPELIKFYYRRGFPPSPIKIDPKTKSHPIKKPATHCQWPYVAIGKKTFRKFNLLTRNVSAKMSIGIEIVRPQEMGSLSISSNHLRDLGILASLLNTEELDQR